MGEYQICRQCIMDTSDPEIEFFNGICNHCIDYAGREAAEVHYGEDWEETARMMIEKIKNDSQLTNVDCVIGLSGGLDSSYAALKCAEFGLKPFGVIVDNGFDTKTSKQNVKNLVKELRIPYKKFDFDTPEFHDLQLSFLKASVINAEAPTDHIITAFLYKIAMDIGLRWIITGGNVVTEAIMPKAWGYDAKDWRHIKAIQKRFGKYSINHLPHLNLFDWVWVTFVKKIKFFPILNWIPYYRDNAVYELEEKIGWQDYGQKHMESRYTRFFQGYFLPHKFGIDKRRPHLSTLINSNQITRKEALEIMDKEYYPEKLRDLDVPLICKKLNINSERLYDMIRSNPRSYKEYSSNRLWFDLFKGFVGHARRVAINA